MSEGEAAPHLGLVAQTGGKAESFSYDGLPTDCLRHVFSFLYSEEAPLEARKQPSSNTIW
jgi:hypothetical protein